MKIKFAVLHSTGRGRIWQRCVRANSWARLVAYYRTREKVDFLITPDLGEEYPSGNIHHISEPGAEYSEAVSSKRLPEQQNIPKGAYDAWAEQAELLALTVERSPKRSIESWPIYRNGIPNSPYASHIEVAPLPGVKLATAFDYAVPHVLHLLSELGHPQLYTHSVLEPKSRIKAGLAWDPPTPFLKAVLDAKNFRVDTDTVAWPAEVEARLVALEKRVARLEGRA